MHTELVHSARKRKLSLAIEKERVPQCCMFLIKAEIKCEERKMLLFVDVKCRYVG